MRGDTKGVTSMSIVIIQTGAFVLLAKYIYQKKPSLVWYFRRRIPDDLAGIIPARTVRSVSL